MRFERLELTRYGAYEGRALDFGAKAPGDGRPDLHLIIGPNEAGKSTLLAAIGDLLFGFPTRTAQDWRFEGRDLRVAATLAHEGRALRIVRRKGSKNTLLAPDGAALAEDTLGAVLGGLDRTGFDRLFGLDHDKLRAGGQAILAGKDDAAQSLFEAGTGMAAVGTVLKRLEAECAELFKPSASIPRINQLLRERHDALDRLRKTTLGEADWTALRDRRVKAEADRTRLIDEDRTLVARANDLERLERARAPLRRLAEARDALTRLGPLPRLPIDAARTLADARAERATALELHAGHLAQLERLSNDIAAIILPAPVLAAATRIDALEEQRPEIDRMRRDLPAKAARLDQIDATIAEARRAVGLPPAAAPPTIAWRRRVRKHIEECRAVEARAHNHAEALRENRFEFGKASEALSEAPDPARLAALREAVTALSPDVIQRLEASEAAARRAADRASAALSGLAWAGSVEALAAAALPSVAEASDHEAHARRALEARTKARDEAAAARAEAAGLRGKLEALAAGGDLPTPEVVAASRDARDRIMDDVRLRLGRARQDDDPGAADRLAMSIGRADLLADRRDAAARQVAEHALAASSLGVANESILAAEAAIKLAAEDLASAQAAWAEVRARAGLLDTLLPSGFAAWREARDRFLERRDEAGIAADQHRRDQAAFEAADAALSRALVEGGASADGDLTTRLRTARALADGMETASRERLGQEARLAELQRGAEGLAREADTIDRLRRDLQAERAELSSEAAIAAPSLNALEDVVEALDGVMSDIGARPGLSHDVDGMKRDIAAFDRDVAVLMVDLGRPQAGPASETIRALAAELAEARRLRAELDRLGKTADEETTARDTVERRLASARSTIATLLDAAGLAEETALDGLLVLVAQAATAAEAEAVALAELADVGPGQSPAALAAAAMELDPGAAAAESEEIDKRRTEITADRETIGGELKAVEMAIDRAASTTDAADAGQAAAEARAALGAGAERWLESAAAAAMLRWLIERHRAGAQAPLLVRAGALFRTVTQGAFDGLALDYGDDDRARIVALRADGTRVGVDGLSEGTRDQLFLALRLGSLQARAGDGALPLICDDLLVTSDDARAGAVLRVLGEAAQTLQVIVFTHHDHIEDVARRALGPDGFRVHRLTPMALATVD